VTELDLSRNAIEEKGAGYISRAFTINLALNKVSLAGNSIRNDGATLIGQPFTVRDGCCIAAELLTRY